jgi:hypothetical protein
MSFVIGGNSISSDDITNGLGPSNHKRISLPSAGLLFHLDAYSYDDNATWYDEAQGIPRASNGTQCSKTTVGNIPCVAFNGSGYFTSNATDCDKVDCTGATTIIYCIYTGTPGGRRTILQKDGTSYNSYEQEHAFTLETARKMSWYQGYDAYDYVNTVTENTCPENAWFLLAGKIDASRQNIYWWTGNAWGSNTNNNRTDNQILRATTLRVGNGYAGTCLSGTYLHSLLIYGHEMGTTQMQQVCDYYDNVFATLGGSISNTS